MHLKNKALKFIRQKSTEVYREIDKSVTWPYLQKFLRVFSLVSKLFPTLLSHGLLHARLPCPLATPEACPNSCQSSWWCHPHPYPQLSPSPPAFSLSQHQCLFKWVSSSHQMAKVWEFQLQHQSFQWIFRTDLLQDGLVGSPCSPRDSQESSPTPQFKSINSSVLSFLYSPTLTSIHDYWKNHSFD